MGIIAWIVLGAIAGFIANMLTGADEGVLRKIVLGIIGALVGGFIAGSVMGLADISGLNIASVAVAVVGAVLVIALVRMISGSRTTARL
jgi:uncharacterized membrane protein YeaQ/YmgE (transglycosylase-associated protein family)